MTCAHCGSEFSATRPNRRFCSDQCRRAARRRRASTVDYSPRSCPVCGELFERQVCVGTPRIYCSRRCCSVAMSRRRTGFVAPPVVRTCWWCDAEFSDVDSRRKYCSAACRALVRHLVDEPDKVNGWSAETYRAVWRMQGGVCKICARPPRGRNSLLCRDHDHVTGHPRALLCDNCNRAIGLLGDDLDRVQRAADYLRQYSVEVRKSA